MKKYNKDENILFRCVQEIFSNEIKPLWTEGKDASNSQIRSLNPYFDEENIL